MKAPELKDQLEESEKLIQEMTVTWEDKLRKTEAVAQVRLPSFQTILMLYMFSICRHVSSLLHLQQHPINEWICQIPQNQIDMVKRFYAFILKGHILNQYLSQANVVYT